MLYELNSEPESNSLRLEMVTLSSLSEADWSEKDLEEALARNINLVLREDRLLVIAQERQWQEEADILALDEAGVLYIFELKRTPSEESNLLQVIRYGQKFGQYGYDGLQHLFRKYINDDSANLAKKHQNFFDLPEPLATREFNHNQRFIVVAAGLDTKALASIEFWRGKGLPIDALTYHVYRHDDHYFLEFHGYSPKPDDYVDLLTNDYIVNTNATYEEKAYREMLGKGKASAYRGRKHAVDKIRKGDRVFLYHTGNGICAMGRAIAEVEGCEFQGEHDAEHFIQLKLEIKADPYEELERCVPAWKINEALDASYKFRQTVFGIDKEMSSTIEKLLRERNR